MTITTRTAPAVLNVRLLNLTLAFTEKHPDLWDQRVFHCGKHMDFLSRALWFADLAVFEESLWPEDGTAHEHEIVNVCGGWHAVHDAARLLLGLTVQQTELLARRDLTLDDLRNIVATIRGDR